MKKFRKPKIKWNEILILVIFIAVVSFTAINIKNLLKREEIKNITEAITTGSSNTAQSGGIFASLYSKEDTELKVTGNAIAVLDIPSRGIRGQIATGTDDETLKNYIGWFESTAEPGQVGNFCVAAHNNIYTELFANLHNVQIGDRVRIVTTKNEYIYRVTSKETVEPDRTDVLDGSTKREITMITCTAAATKRVVVKGELVSEKTLE
ncbi:MAG: class D sortase [Clostridia bacterium]|nr:class D sortase [Clostridia bacterium]